MGGKGWDKVRERAEEWEGDRGGKKVAEGRCVRRSQKTAFSLMMTSRVRIPAIP